MAMPPHLVLLVAGIVDGVEPVVVGAFAHGIFGGAGIGKDDVVMAPVEGHAVGLGSGLILRLAVVLGGGERSDGQNDCQDGEDQTGEPKHMGVLAQDRLWGKRAVQYQSEPPTFKKNRALATTV
jgi:F0F1-type ATP synthase beta subunit